MAYLTQYSSSVPVIKFLIDQSVMTIGQDFDMDICIPEDSIAENHAFVEAIKSSEKYRFVVKAQENEEPLNLNGETVAQAELKDGDWITIGGIEFQFTDDGVNEISQIAKPPTNVTPIKLKAEEVNVINTMSDALSLIKELKHEVELGLLDKSTEDKPISTKDFIRNSRLSRRRTAY